MLSCINIYYMWKPKRVCVSGKINAWLPAALNMCDNTAGWYFFLNCRITIAKQLVFVFYCVQSPQKDFHPALKLGKR